ncbi:hypothetical protein [Brevundimonas sp.]|uniref:hypothetical protein n=1 Tax=Brevundimonas sp. TaxID=1871086 RepID=UPI002737F16C|nr:hypothetical protein [Brevundimonas sp.]MDP3803583.1 hypothetical protein [Brevundimonas sp.]
MTLPAFSLDGLAQAALVLHISGGALGLVSGFAALAAPKGRRLHRAAGTVFVLAMAVMAFFAMVVALQRNQPLNAIGGAFTLYLIGTAWLAVRRPDGVAGRAETTGFLAASAIAAAGLVVGWQGAGGDGIPGPVPYVFASVAALGAASDLRVILRRGVSGPSRIARHLWRMCTALFIASGSFFLGQMDEIPQALRGPHLFVLALAPLAALLFWMFRVRLTRAFKSVPATP